ncbi:hypothetical protein TrST_g10794 [Triparma strigata]|uniref:Uncharacterized protein n=1 Tax=Triparma strigata TaxID=1606541 RepID=A0A9W7F2Z7_9STRA|nr:hypothetical protein TrST_g10794 [Triparma strigata]
MSKTPKHILISNETVTTERTFVEQMETTLLVYVQPLAANPHIIPPATQSALFSNIETLFKFNTEFLKALETDAASNPDGNRRIGKIFKQFAPFFKMFTLYLNNFEKAMELHTNLMLSNAQYRDFINHSQQDPRCKGHNLMNMLITPVQRVPRYKLLLEDLFKALPPTEPDYKDLEVALDLVSQSAKHNNEAIRRRENQDKILEIQMKFEEGTSVNLLDNPSREFLMMGDMTKLSRRGPQQHTFWLFNDLLLYGDKKLNGSYKVNRSIQLLKCQVSSPSEEEVKASEDVKQELPVDCMVYVDSDEKSFVVYAETKEKRIEWVKKINQAIEDLRTKFKAETGQLAPRWKPNNSASACSCCGKKFSFTNRKHHCRNCGDVVCGECSQTRILLKHIDEKYKVRVCDSCKDGGPGTKQNDEEIKIFLRMMKKEEYVVKEVPKHNPPTVTVEEIGRPDWAVDGVDRLSAGGDNFSVSTPNPIGVPSPDLRLQTFRPKAPAPVAAPPPPPPGGGGAGAGAGAGAGVPPAKPVKPPKPAKPPKKPQAGAGAAAPQPVVPKRPAKFSRSGGKEDTNPERAADWGANPVAQSANGRFYPLSQLQDKNSCPPNVDPKNRELFLSDLDFMGVFGMTKDQYKNKAAWQKVVLKKKANLF